MRHRTLQRQRWRQAVDVGGVAASLVDGHEAEVVVDVRHLRLPAGVDDVDLRGDLVPGPSQASQISAKVSLA